MENDFDPKVTMREVPWWEGQRQHKTFTPAVGNKIVVAYIEGNDAAIAAKLAEIEAMAVTFKKYWWAVTAEPEHQPSVNVRVTVRTDA